VDPLVDRVPIAGGWSVPSTRLSRLGAIAVVLALTGCGSSTRTVRLETGMGAARLHAAREDARQVEVTRRDVARRSPSWPAMWSILLLGGRNARTIESRVIIGIVMRHRHRIHAESLSVYRKKW
jgi:hypothetical protein